MQEYCIRNQLAAATRVVKLIKQAEKESVEHKVIKKCLHDWHRKPIVADYSFDYRMVQYCVDHQMTAYRNIQ